MPRSKVATDSVPAQAGANWRLKYAGPFEFARDGWFHFYDGSLQAHDGFIEVPRDRPDWAQRLLRYEHFEWPEGEAPDDFITY